MLFAVELPIFTTPIGEVNVVFQFIIQTPGDNVILDKLVNVALDVIEAVFVVAPVIRYPKAVEPIDEYVVGNTKGDDMVNVPFIVIEPWEMGYWTYNLLALATDKVDVVFGNSFVLNEGKILVGGWYETPDIYNI